MVAETTSTPTRMAALTWSDTGQEWIGRFARSRAGLFGACIVLLVVLVACIGPTLAPYPADAVNLSTTLLSPSLAHLMGTDSVGRDVFSRMLSGGRIALEVGAVSVGIAIAIGVPVGLLAGYYGKAVDAVVMAGNDVLLAFPYMLLALLVVAVLGPSLGSTMIAVGVVYVPQYVRLVRGVVLSAKARDYVLAAKAAGARDVRIMFRHILPNCLSSITIQASLSFGSAIVSASTLSFLGLGAQPPTPEWGAMLRDGSSYMQTAPWMATFPGLMIFLAVIGFNLLGDGLRDALDPRRES